MSETSPGTTEQTLRHFFRATATATHSSPHKLVRGRRHYLSSLSLASDSAAPSSRFLLPTTPSPFALVVACFPSVLGGCRVRRIVFSRYPLIYRVLLIPISLDYLLATKQTNASFHFELAAVTSVPLSTKHWSSSA